MPPRSIPPYLCFRSSGDRPRSCSTCSVSIHRRNDYAPIEHVCPEREAVEFKFARKFQISMTRFCARIYGSNSLIISPFSFLFAARFVPSRSYALRLLASISPFVPASITKRVFFASCSGLIPLQVLFLIFFNRLLQHESDCYHHFSVYNPDSWELIAAGVSSFWPCKTCSLSSGRLSPSSWYKGNWR